MAKKNESQKRQSMNHAQRRKAESAAAIRERLKQYGHHQQAAEILENLQDVAGKKDPMNAAMESIEVQRLGKALDGHIKIMQMYIPKPVELSQDKENPLFESSDDARFSELRRLQEIIERGSNTSDPAQGTGSKPH